MKNSSGTCWENYYFCLKVIKDNYLHGTSVNSMLAVGLLGLQLQAKPIFFTTKLIVALSQIKETQTWPTTNLFSGGLVSHLTSQQEKKKGVISL